MKRMQEQYVKNVVPQLQEKFQFSSAMQIPRITMISINMGLGEAVGNKKIIESAVADRAKKTAKTTHFMSSICPI